MKIGELARRAGISTEAIRYYEKQGLLPPPERLASGYRTYRPEALERLRVVKVCQQIGFTLDDIALLLEPHRAVAQAARLGADDAAARLAIRTAAERHLAVIEDRLALLDHMRGELAHLIEVLAGRAPQICPAARKSPLDLEVGSKVQADASSPAKEPPCPANRSS
jgi:MerR family copper efflux transcriptional regulator